MSITNRLPNRAFSLTAFTTLLLSPVAEAVTIAVTLDPVGPVAIGQQIDVDLSVTGWVVGDGGVDSVAFNVDFDPVVFSYVGFSGFALSDGSEFLAESTQGAGYSHSDDSSDANVGFGRFTFGASDVGDALAGSIGGADGAGILGGFKLEAIALATDSVIMSGANDPNEVFGDNDFFGITPTGGVTFGSATITVIVPEPATLLSIMAGLGLVALRRTRKQQQ